MINYFNFLEEKVDSKALLWNHYVNCCKTLGTEIDMSIEEYFNKMDEERLEEIVDYFNLRSK
ncbi:hypothetical protein BC351_00680 [Paenibacillus ferrarius]|uniref:Uncharacterized protein n=1 Tax=Paenibacillus ferrarius TaxID=1469647 RepID=A0A1V4HSM5_9BACL|nr:hypothetical protein BC351_00680 [Paenibacillus ferrarius]